MKTVNCIGDFCPIPILKIKHALETLAPGESMLAVTDLDCVLESIDTFLDRTHVLHTVQETDDQVFEITITRID